MRPSALAARTDKPCPSCGSLLPVSEYGRDATSEDGYFSLCKSCRKTRSAVYYRDPAVRAKMLADNRQWHKENRAKATRRMIAYYKRRRDIDPDFRIARTIKARIILALKLQGAKKAVRTCELLGCSIPNARDWIQSLFQPGMTWDNHGLKGWHIDHKKPISSFDLTREDQQRQCFHFTNLQPLWAIDNIRKGDKIHED